MLGCALSKWGVKRPSGVGGGRDAWPGTGAVWESAALEIDILMGAAANDMGPLLTSLCSNMFLHNCPQRKYHRL